MLVGILATANLHVAELLLRVRADRPELRHPIDYVDRQSETVDLVSIANSSGVLMLPFSL